MKTLTLAEALRWLALAVDADTAKKLKAQALRADVTEQRARNAVAQVLQMDERLKSVAAVADRIDAEAGDSGNDRLYNQAMDHVALIRAALNGEVTP